MAPYDSEPLDHSLELHELHYQLILIQHWCGTSKANQVEVASPGGFNKLGNMVANDWDLEDPCQNGKIVAHAKGLHVQASREEASWHASFDIVFEQGSGLEGSTLQVMGPNVFKGEWSIVGGTGKLTMARGVIYKKYLTTVDSTSKIDLQIHAFYIPMERKDAGTSGKNVWRW
ncbi:uncharacterized protein [Zea mays]|uniref:Dirigent protein n=1 Tax=Zea mays TaxID=4577 RepID=K7U735_MAIZE|nr:uncharacterized protein LOC103654365 [Zea mays]AQK57462.1 hypothetical protein ZEAMMB73_Zm00001d052585 [Zea mays]|eukprot:XP_008679436.1 uncharacterized protein LOC103654365 [Zea mays]